MATTTAQIRDLLLPGLDAVFGKYSAFPRQWPEIFEKHTSDMAYERDVEVRLLGLAQQRTEGAATAFDDGMGERYMYVYRHVGVALGFVMTKFAIRDNLYKTQFGPNVDSLKRSLLQTEEVYGANVLNNALDGTNYAGGDGVSLLSAAHPIDAGTVANTPSVQAELNETSLQDAMVAIRRFKDAAGLRVLVKPKKLIVTPELQFVAKRLLDTTSRVGTSDNDTNALRSLLSVSGGWTINDFLTNTKSWYVTTDVDNGLKMFQRDPLETDMHTDFTTDNLMVKATQRFSFGWSNFRGIYGSMP